MILKNKVTGEIIESLPKLVTTTIKGILIVDIESKVWLITNDTTLNVTDQFDSINEVPEEPEVVIDKCALNLTFSNNYVRVLEGDFNKFTVSVNGNSIYNVEFKSSVEDWKTGVGASLNEVKIKVPASGNNEDIWARIAGCTKEFKISVSTLPKVVIVEEEIEVGSIKFSESVIYKFVVKLAGGSRWLLQTDDARSFYQSRGLNILTDSRVTVDQTKFNKNELQNDEITGIGGLQPFINNVVPARWPLLWWTSLGYYTDSDSRMIKGTAPVVPPIVTPVEPVIPVTPPVVTPPYSGDKINIPMGAIFWDNWERDYWADNGLSRDRIEQNHIGKNRLAATEWKHKFPNIVPFYGQHTEPENILITYNVKWDASLGRNAYDEATKAVTVKFDRTNEDRDREFKYYADAKFKWLCFNYYSDDSYLSTTRRHFVATSNKYGLKMTFMLATNRSDQEVDYITSLMMQDYWFKIDGKPVLYFNSGNYPEEQRYRNALRNKGGGELYLVYYAFGGVPGDVNDLLSKRPQACSAYSQSSDDRTPQGLITTEVNSRKAWMSQFSHLFDYIPVLTVGFEELGLRTSLDQPRGPGVQACSAADLETKCKLVIEDLKVYNKDSQKLRAILWYAGNEILETGNPLVPSKRIDGSINTENLDAISKYIE